MLLIKVTDTTALINHLFFGRRSRNRLSQRHFRERRTQYIKQLEQQVQCLTMSDNERNASLIAENKALKASLARVRTLLARLTSFSTEVEETITETLNEPKDDTTSRKPPSNDGASVCSHETIELTFSSTDEVPVRYPITPLSRMASADQLRRIRKIRNHWSVGML